MDKDNIIYLTKRAINNNGRFRVDEDYMELDSNDIDHIAEEIACIMSNEFELKDKKIERLKTLLYNAICIIDEEVYKYNEETINELGMNEDEYNEIVGE